MRSKKIGEIPPGWIPIHDALGNHRGRCTAAGTAMTAARFGVKNAKLKTINGRKCWVGQGKGGTKTRNVTSVE